MWIFTLIAFSIAYEIFEVCGIVCRIIAAGIYLVHFLATDKDIVRI